jgi:hypothetical protein
LVLSVVFWSLQYGVYYRPWWCRLLRPIIHLDCKQLHHTFRLIQNTRNKDTCIEQLDGFDFPSAVVLHLSLISLLPLSATWYSVLYFRLHNTEGTMDRDCANYDVRSFTSASTAQQGHMHSTIWCHRLNSNPLSSFHAAVRITQDPMNVRSEPPL